MYVHGRSQDFFRGEHFLKNFKNASKNSHKIRKKFTKNSEKIFKKYWKNFQKISKIRENIRKFSNVFLRKLRKMHYFSRFFTKLKKACAIFWAFGRKHILLEFLRIISKILKKFLKKLRKTKYFSRVFTKFKKPCVNLLCVWTKKTIYWKFWEKFQKLSKVFLRKLQKCIT